MNAVSSITNPNAYYEHHITVVESEIDDLQHVNNAVYLRYAEQCAREHCESLGFTLEAFKKHGVIPVVRKHMISYHHPATLHDQIIVSTQVTKMGGAKAERLTQVKSTNTKLYAEIVTEWVWLEPTTFRPLRIPEAILNVFGDDAK